MYDIYETLKLDKSRDVREPLLLITDLTEAPLPDTSEEVKENHEVIEI
jgi:hypothetical protein